MQQGVRRMEHILGGRESQRTQLLPENPLPLFPPAIPVLPLAKSTQTPEVKEIPHEAVSAGHLV